MTTRYPSDVEARRRLCDLLLEGFSVEPAEPRPVRESFRLVTERLEDSIRRRTTFVAAAPPGECKP